MSDFSIESSSWDDFASVVHIENGFVFSEAGGTSVVKLTIERRDGSSFSALLPSEDSERLGAQLAGPPPTWNVKHLGYLVGSIFLLGYLGATIASLGSPLVGFAGAFLTGIGAGALGVVIDRSVCK